MPGKVWKDFGEGSLVSDIRSLIFANYPGSKLVSHPPMETGRKGLIFFFLDCISSKWLTSSGENYSWVVEDTPQRYR